MLESKCINDKMENRLKEIKEKIQSFVNDYNIKEFDIYINEDIEWSPCVSGGGNYRHVKKIEIELRV